MKSFNWDAIQSTAQGEFTPLPAGPYVAKVLDAIDKPEKEYVEVIFDIAEGEHAGYYSDDWGKAHPYAHHFFMSYKDTAKGMLKGTLDAFQKSNPGFDPFAAWNAGRLDMFRSRIVGVNLQEEEYRDSNDEIRTRLNVCARVDAQQVRDGKVKPCPRKTLGGGSKPSTAPSKPAPKFDDSELPWMK